MTKEMCCDYTPPLAYLGEAADNDGIDNDDDFFIDEPDETRETGYLALYPETGLHFWLTPHLRLTGSAAYNFSTAGREHDAWMFTMELAFLGTDSPPPLPERADEPIDFGAPPAGALRRLPAVSHPPAP